MYVQLYSERSRARGTNSGLGTESWLVQLFLDGKRAPTEDKRTKYQRVRPIINEILQGKGLVKVAEDKFQ
ncbi:MAG: hypothetical protein ACLQA5_23350 [Solirubrobacteraceae bacterium]